MLLNRSQRFHPRRTAGDALSSPPSPPPAGGTCTPETLTTIAADGFTAVWPRGRLRRLRTSAVFPELDDPDRAATIAAAGRLLGRLRRAGLGLHLSFNEPLMTDCAAPKCSGCNGAGRRTRSASMPAGSI